MAMDLNKSRDFFDPAKVTKVCHIIGVGSIGSNVAELLTRYGIKKMVFWDFDKVESHNIANQIFYSKHIGVPKVDALEEICSDINDKVEITKKPEGWNGQPLYGYVFLCVDSIELRRKIVEASMLNRSIDAIFDFRTTLLEGQSYFANWKNQEDKEDLLHTMQFTDAEVKEETPVSACGFELSVSPVVKETAIAGVCNFTNYINDKQTRKVIIKRPYSFQTTAL